MFLKTYDFDFDDIIIIFTDQSDRPLEIEGKADLILLINKNKQHVILQNQVQENTLKDMDFCLYREIVFDKYDWILLQKPD